jgi:alkylhydroperoxidase family enzyme
LTVKTDMSRFNIHDELTAPGASSPILKALVGTGAEISKFVGVLAGAPAVLRAYTRMRSELRAGVLPEPTRRRIALAVAEHRGDAYNLGPYATAARAAGLGLDEVSRARSFKSADPREAALLKFLEDALTAQGWPQHHLLEEAREAGWSDEELLEALAYASLTEFESLIARSGALPQDHTAPRVLPSAA